MQTQTHTDAPGAYPSSPLTIVGFGDVGQAYAKALLGQGVAVRIHHPAPGVRALEAARAMGMVIETDPARAFARCALALNVAPGLKALPVARAAAPHMPAGRLAAALAPLGFVVQVLADSQPGDATALKLVRSVLTKGMDAVITECLLLAQALGLRETLLSNIGDLDNSSLSELIAMFIRTHAPHAQRRLHEMETVEDMLKDLGVPLIVTPAVRARYARTVAMLGANAQLPEGAEGAALFECVLPWMLDAERRLPAAAST